MNDDGSLQLFLEGFAARDLAEPLASFDEGTPTATIRSVMQVKQLEFVGIRRQGIVVGWIANDDLERVRSIEEAVLVADSASLNEVVQGLDRSWCVLVRSLGQVGGIICRRDLQKPAMRMWLFGLVTISELRVTEIIEECCPNDGWQQYLSAGRLQKAREFQQERSRRGQTRSLLDCLQFADKGRIVARDEHIRARTRFSTKRQAEDFVAALQDLRNNLAHAQDLMGDWGVICELATNLHRIVLGPPATVATVSP